MCVFTLMYVCTYTCMPESFCVCVCVCERAYMSVCIHVFSCIADHASYSTGFTPALYIMATSLVWMCTFGSPFICCHLTVDGCNHSFFS